MASTTRSDATDLALAQLEISQSESRPGVSFAEQSDGFGQIIRPDDGSMVGFAFMGEGSVFGFHRGCIVIA